MRLGIEIDHADGKTLSIDAVTGGLAEKWNVENPGKVLQQGDRIIEINGAAGDALLLMEECRQNKVLEMLVRQSPQAKDLGPELFIEMSLSFAGGYNYICDEMSMFRRASLLKRCTLPYVQLQGSLEIQSMKVRTDAMPSSSS